VARRVGQDAAALGSGRADPKRGGARREPRPPAQPDPEDGSEDKRPDWLRRQRGAQATLRNGVPSLLLLRLALTPPGYSAVRSVQRQVPRTDGRTRGICKTVGERWVVLLEAATDGSEITRLDVETLLEAVRPGPSGGALYDRDRYAIQLEAAGSNPAEALFGALCRWADAVRHLRLPASEIVRTEVLTPEELKRELQHPALDATPIRPSAMTETEDHLGQELLLRAFSDTLTGVLSPGAFNHRLAAALARDGQHAVVALDLDRFEAVNERVGGVAGDLVLREVARRLMAALRPGDDLGRVGGDCYAVLLKDADEAVARAVAGRMLDTVRQPLTIGEQEITITASAGIVLTEPWQDAESVMHAAEAGVAAAKHRGGGCHVLA
jgi:diguanylate cyclase (GGDEF)-like protein